MFAYGTASERQARMLKEYGFTVWARRINPNAPKGKIRKPSIAWIKKNVGAVEAGVALRMLGYRRKKQADMPERPMVGEPTKSLYEEAMEKTYGSSWQSKSKGKSSKYKGL